MALKNQAITVCYVAWNTSANGGQTGDAANHTLKLVQDGTEANPTNAPAEVDSTNAPGVYKLVLAAADMNFNCVVLCGKSSTANVSIIPLVIVTERGVLPTVAPATSGGLPTCDSTGLVSIDLAATLGAPRALDAIADGSVTITDALWSAVGAGTGKQDASSGNNLIVQTPSTGTTLRTFAITAAPSPFGGGNVPVKRS